MWTRILAVSSLAVVVTAQQWRRTNATPAPRYRWSHAIAFDEVRGRTVLFGGQTDNGVGSMQLNDTWEWDGLSWTQRSPATSPPPRFGHAMVFDAARGRMILFGGYREPSIFYSDTWVWDGSNWTEQHPINHPSIRQTAGLAYDSTRQRAVLFGGGFFSQFFDETWEWDGSDWAQVSPAVHPSHRVTPAMAFDASRGRVVLYGGSGSAGALSDTWEWDGATWTLRATASSPGAIHGASMAYDSARSVSVLFGGDFSSNATWEWDGRGWLGLALTPAPPADRYRAMTYDSGRRQVVLALASGQMPPADTSVWEYGPPGPAFTTFGAGCPGTNGMPLLAATTLPRIGQVFRLSMTSLPINAPGLLFFGASRASWGLLPLPLRLDPIGMTSCQLLVSGDVLLGLPSSGGSGSVLLSVPLPNDPGIVGGQFFNQGFFPDLGANPGGVVATNGGWGVVGT